MSFNEGSGLDPSEVEDRRGMSRGTKTGLGVGGVLVVLVASLLGINPDLVNSVIGGIDGSSGSQTTTQQSPGSAAVDQCRTGADANNRLDCRITGTVNSLNTFWSAELPKWGVNYQDPKTVLFSNQTNTGCGSADVATGPFYCPVDKTAYFDPSFFNDLTTRFGASGGPLAQEYVVAHEFGHHIQDELGQLGQSQQDPQGENSGSVRTELQADCYAGIWAKNAATTPDPKSGKPFLEPLSEKDVSDALSAAAAVGDDHIQQESSGQVDPDVWTHGSSAERQAWFMQGYRTGDLRACDTFSAPDLRNP